MLAITINWLATAISYFTITIGWFARVYGFEFPREMLNYLSFFLNAYKFITHPIKDLPILPDCAIM
jgi:hypothetical protein